MMRIPVYVWRDATFSFFQGIENLSHLANQVIQHREAASVGREQIEGMRAQLETTYVKLGLSMRSDVISDCGSLCG